MQTGLVSSWFGDPTQIGPLYPFVGWEVALFVLCFALWMLFVVWQIRSESREYADRERELGDGDALAQAIENDADL